MEKKATIGQILSIFQWPLLLLIGLLFCHLLKINTYFAYIFPLIMFIAHTIEAILFGIPIGTKKGYTKLESLALTWLYGFTWWKFLK